MYDQSKTFIRDTITRDIVKGEAFDDSGIIATYTRMEGGTLAVQRSKGGDKEQFAGITLTRAVPPSVMNHVIEDVVPASHKVDMARNPIVGQLLVVIAEAKAELVADVADLAAGKVLIEGDMATFHKDDEGKELRIQFAYNPTVEEAQRVLGDAPIGGLSEQVTDRVTLITSGQVGTSFFDASADWAGSAELNPRLGADGKLTLEGTGTVLKNVFIVEAPSSENASLVIDIQ